MKALVLRTRSVRRERRSRCRSRVGRRRSQLRGCVSLRGVHARARREGEGTTHCRWAWSEPSRHIQSRPAGAREAASRSILSGSCGSSPRTVADNASLSLPVHWSATAEASPFASAAARHGGLEGRPRLAGTDARWRLVVHPRRSEPSQEVEDETRRIYCVKYYVIRVQQADRLLPGSQCPCSWRLQPHGALVLVALTHLAPSRDKTRGDGQQAARPQL